MEDELSVHIGTLGLLIGTLFDRVYFLGDMPKIWVKGAR